jgi:hypothetical protein
MRSKVVRSESFVNSTRLNVSESPSFRMTAFRWSVHCSVTRQPTGVRSISYSQREIRKRCQVTSKAKRSDGSKVVTLAMVDHESSPWVFVPLKRAPWRAVVTPLSHSPPVFSGEKRRIPGKSDSAEKTRSGDAAMSIESDSCMLRHATQEPRENLMLRRHWCR